MNFGQPTRPISTPEDTNNFDVVSSPNLNTQEIDWDQSIERNQQSIGSKVNAAANAPEYIPNPNQEIAPTPNLGEVVTLDTSMPPGSQSVESGQFDSASLNPDITNSIKPHSFKEEGGKLPAHAVKEVDQVINEVSDSPDSLANLVNRRDAMVGKYLDGSFGRKTVYKPQDEEAA